MIYWFLLIPMSDKIQAMFAAIANRYDSMNDFLSLGIHRSWRRKAVNSSGVRPGMSVLDCACGTGDFSLAFKRAVGAEGSVVGTDFCEPMVVLAQEKATKRNSDVSFAVQNVLSLNFADHRFDVASIAFGIRNVDDPIVCLRELGRVVKPGGTVVILEFGQPRGAFGILFQTLSLRLMPLLGRIFAKNRAAYEYLPRSAAQFPCREDFLSLMEASGVFAACSYRSLTCDVAFVYLGTTKP